MVVPSYNELTARLLVFWLQPIFWMLFFHIKRPTWKSTSTLVYPMLAVISLGLNDIFSLGVLDFLPSHRLLISYGTIGLIFAWHLMNNKGWPFTQALSFSAMIVFAASFYWEIPVFIRNAFLLGYESDWLLHILSIFPYWYLYKAVGFNKRYNNHGIAAIFIIGILISTVFLYNNPIPNLMTYAWEFWDSPYYLTNRVICTTITFYLFDTDRSAIARYVK